MAFIAVRSEHIYRDLAPRYPVQQLSELPGHTVVEMIAFIIISSSSITIAPGALLLDQDCPVLGDV